MSLFSTEYQEKRIDEIIELNPKTSQTHTHCLGVINRLIYAHHKNFENID